MKYIDLQKITRNSVFVVGLAVVTVLPVAAQPSNTSNSNRVETTTRTVDTDTDWGWLGLLGLLGLAGLIPKKRHVEVVDNRTDQTSQTRSGTGTTN